MFITDLSIRRPVVSWVMSLILVLFGIFVFWKLPVRELPSGLQPPVVQVKVDYKSASAPIIDQEVTQVVEDVISALVNLGYNRSEVFSIVMKIKKDFTLKHESKDFTVGNIIPLALKALTQVTK